MIENLGRLPHDPTEEQIREACWLIQARWSAAERERRAVVKVERWSAPVVEYDDELPAEW